MKTLCNNKSPVGVIGPVFHSVFAGSEIETFFHDFTSPLVKRVRSEVYDKKIKGYSPVAMRVVQIPNMDRNTSEIVLFYKKNGERRKSRLFGDFAQGYEYVVFHFFSNPRKTTLVYGTNRPEFVNDFPVQSSYYFTSPSWDYNYKNGHHQFLTQPDPRIPAYKFLCNTWNNSYNYFGEPEQVEVIHFREDRRDNNFEGN